ncbi:hypothetical protein UFOVP627_35 [uncultured Caudovirales phage]|uniref:Uncharacterized protein n=1 Tax=uncultured Caudovirales phage TaxID=2100421 RepID=A0A6J5N978_9CAUD|nr:hypothetical protein UFOVP627_35 [uncultured Caudovirales phage]
MAEKKTIELEIKTDSVKSLKTQLREAQQEVQALSDKFGATSEAAVKAARKAAELKDKIGDAKALTDAFNPDAKFQALTSSLSGVAAGFGAVQGAMGLMGGESAELQKTLLKVQSAMALSQSLQQLGQARDSFKQLGAVIKNVFSGVKGAIAASGIGLLLIALGTLYNYWDDIKGAIGGVSAEQEKLNVKVAKNLEIENEKLSKISDQDNVLKLQGKSEKEILALKIKQVDAVILATEAQIEQDKITRESQIAAAKRNHDYLKGFIDFITLPTKKLTEYFAKFVNMSSDVLAKIGIDIDKFDLKAIDEAFNKTNDKLASYIFDVGDTKAEADKIIKEHEKTLTKLKNDKAGFQLEIQKIDKEASNKTKEKNNKDLEDELERRRKSTEDILDLETDLLIKKRLDDEKEKERKDKLFQDNIKRAQDETKKMVEINEQDLKNKQKHQERVERLRKQDLDLVSNGFKLIGDFTDLMGKRTEKERRRAFKIKKAADLASAAIDGTKAVLSTYADTPGGPIIKGVAAGIAGAFSAIQIAKISKQQFDGGGASGGGGGTNSSTPSTPNPSSGVIAPKFNVVGASANQLNTLQQQPIQAYVVSGDVTSAQSLDRNRIKNATL